MAFIPGISGGIQMVPVGSPTSPNNSTGSGPVTDTVIIDGTPVRVVVLCLAAAAGLTALRLGGFRFNVGVSS